MTGAPLGRARSPLDATVRPYARDGIGAGGTPPLVIPGASDADTFVTAGAVVTIGPADIAFLDPLSGAVIQQATGVAAGNSVTFRGRLLAGIVIRVLLGQADVRASVYLPRQCGGQCGG